MPTTRCTHCGGDFQYAETFAGGSVGCPLAGCGGSVQLPYLDGTFPKEIVTPSLPAGPPRSENYYLRKQFNSSVVVGPLPRGRIRELVLKGRIGAEDELSADRKKWWAAIRVEPEFFGRDTMRTSCELCGAAVVPGDAKCAACKASGAETSLDVSAEGYGVGDVTGIGSLRSLKAPEPIAEFASARKADAIVAASLDGWLGLFRANDSAPTRTWQFGAADQVRVAVADKGGFAVVAATSGSVSRIFVADFERRRLADVLEMDRTIRELALDPNGKYVALVDDLACVRLYRVEPWKRVDKFPVRGERFAFDLANDRLAAADAQGLLFIWNLQSGKIERELWGPAGDLACPASTVGLAFSLTGTRVFAGSGFLVKPPIQDFRLLTDKQAFWLGAGKSLLLTGNPISALVGGVRAQTVMNNADWIIKDMEKRRWAEACNELARLTRLRSWDVRTGKMTAELIDVFSANPTGIAGAYFPPTGAGVVTSGPKNVHIWDLSTGGSRGPLYLVSDENEARTATAVVGKGLKSLISRVDFTQEGDEALILVAGARQIRVATLPQATEETNLTDAIAN